MNLAAAVLALLPGLAAAQEAIEAPGRLTDEDFYRLVACAAPPGGDCAKPFLRWQTDRPVRVALREVAPAYTGRRKPRAEAAVARAVRALNAVEAGFRLARVAADAPAEIDIHFLDIVPGSASAGLAGLDGNDTATRLAIDPDSGVIREAAMIVNSTLETARFEATLLTALTRAMGLTTALAGSAYAEISALAENASQTRLAPQDIAALRQHYAAPPR